MEKQAMSQLMKNAWELYRSCSVNTRGTFAICLKVAWQNFRFAARVVLVALNPNYCFKMRGTKKQQAFARLLVVRFNERNDGAVEGSELAQMFETPSEVYAGDVIDLLK